MKQKTALLLVLTLLLSLLSGCGGSEKAYVPTGDALVMEGEDPPVEEDSSGPQELTLAYYADRSMNPIQSTDYTNRALFSLIYQGLFSVDSDYNAVPILCKSFQASPDLKSFTFYIENATFSDGTPLTIEDVLASYEAAKDNKNYAGRFTHVRDIAITEDGGIRFSLATPYEDFPLLLDIPIMQASQVEAPAPLGTGPYVFETSLAGTHLRKNSSWWCRSDDLVITAEVINLVEAQNPSHIRDEFEFRDVGVVCANPCAATYADYRCDLELWDCDTGIMVYLGFNINYSQEDIFEDPDLRSALTYAIDREAINEKFYNGHAKPATLPAEPGTPYYSNTLAEKYQYDSLRFIQVLSRTTKTDEPLRLLVNSDDSIRLELAKDLAQTLTEYGLPTEVKSYSSAGYVEVYRAGNFDMYLGQVKLSSNMDLSEFFRPYGDLARNGVSDAATYSRCQDALANRGNYYNLHQQVMDEGRICPIVFHSYAVYATRGLVTDLEPSRDNVYFYTLGKTVADIQIETDYTE